ncbi:hypothetical protein [Kitasatospora purpeofusca]|uniref:hypothetical protein n=1 Tax=Kitasatospora purpeofusca TaxID=67352 RepID=UPI00386B0788|nr:hypothetical protein OIP63_35610 [Kitasatospora purpeofusca]
MESLITAVAAHREAADFLSWPGDFDLDRGDHVEEVHLASGAALEGFAGDGAGGTFFFCGDGGEERPVLYADSEGQAAVVASGLRELLQLLLVAPWWRDCREFTGEESAELAAEYLEDLPDLAERRDRAAAALGLTLPAPAEALSRLREVALAAGPEFVLVLTSEGGPYEPLIEG